jgi:hypothetical protein
MRLSLLTLASIASISFAQTTQPDLSATAATFPPGPDSNSTLLKITTPPGPYNVTIREDPNFPNRTIYVPERVALANKTVPILAWENGICYKYGRMYAAFLTEIASHGYLVITPGPPNQLLKGMTTAKWQTDSIDYALNWKEAPFRIDRQAIAIGGHSCGGIESLKNVANDPSSLIKTALILNSASSDTTFDSITSPLLIIHGGETDIALPVEDNFRYIKENVPDLVAFKAVLQTGHLGSFWSSRGGIYAETSVRWLDWHLKGERGGRKWFQGAEESGAAKRGWKVESLGIEE